MGAVISECGLYRYELVRELGDTGPTIGWCLHNPSTADAEIDDPTSRRGIAFSRAWGAKRMIFVNPWAFRSTDKDGLWRVLDPVGPDNNAHIGRVARECADTGGFMVLGWGKVDKRGRARLKVVEQIIRDAGCDVRCLRTIKDGSPEHPLYIPNAAVPAPWPMVPPPGGGGETGA